MITLGIDFGKYFVDAAIVDHQGASNEILDAYILDIKSAVNGESLDEDEDEVNYNDIKLLSFQHAQSKIEKRFL